MIKFKRKFTISVLLMSLCVLGLFAPVATARDAFAPSWLKEGTYVKYEAKMPDENTMTLGFTDGALVGFFELSNPQFAGTNYMLPQPVDLLLATEKCSVMWRCVDVNATMAKLKVTLDCIGEPMGTADQTENKHLQRDSEIYVDLYTRAVYNAKGTFLGTTHLWLPANPKVDQKITIWEEGTETVTAPVKISGSQATNLGQLTVFELDIETVTIKKNIQSLSNSYDLGTGLGVSTQYGSMWDPIFASVGIQHGGIKISETNINFESAPSEINWTRMLYYAIIPLAIILLVATLIIKRKKKKN